MKYKIKEVTMHPYIEDDEFIFDTLEEARNIEKTLHSDGNWAIFDENDKEVK
jgi:hypothetical protein